MLEPHLYKGVIPAWKWISKFDSIARAEMLSQSSLIMSFQMKKSGINLDINLFFIQGIAS